jgi:hypothetical protein
VTATHREQPALPDDRGAREAGFAQEAELGLERDGQVVRVVVVEHALDPRLVDLLRAHEIGPRGAEQRASCALSRTW